MTINAIRLAVDGTVTEHDLSTIEAEKDYMRIPVLLDADLMEGFGFQNAALDAAHIWAYCDEEGRLTGKEVNPVASIMLGHISPYPALVGPIVFVAEDIYDEETDEETANPPLSAEQIETIKSEAAQALDFARMLDLV